MNSYRTTCLEVALENEYNDVALLLFGEQLLGDFMQVEQDSKI